MRFRELLSWALVALVCVVIPSVANAGTADLLGYGETLAGSIDVVGEVDVHTFNAEAGDIVLVRLGETTSAIEPELYVTGPTVESYHATDTNLAEILTAPLQFTGVYTISVLDDGHNDTGGYSLHIQRINGPAGATALSFGTTGTGSLPTVATTVAYTLDGAAGDRVLLRMTEAVTGSYLTPRLRVYQTDGTLVATAYNSYTAEMNTMELPATGTYTVLALENSGIYTGDYHLHCQRMNDPVGALGIAYGQTLPGDLSQRAEADVYRFVGTDFDLLVARLGETTTAIEPLLRLYDASGVQLAGTSDTSLAELPLTALPGSEMYTLLVLDDPGLDTGGYSLHIQRVNGPASATALSFGTTQAGSLPTVATTVAYTLDGAAGDRVLLRMTEAVTGSYLTPRLRVYQTDGTLVATTYNSYTAELNTVTLPAAGTYTVLALDNTGIYPGDYQLHCQRMNGPVGAVPITYGQTVAGDLTIRSETDCYSLSGTAADLLLARLGETTSAIEPLLRLYDGSGIQVAATTHSSLAELPLTALPASETYTLLVLDDPGLDTGGYSLHIQRVNGPILAVPLDYGTTQLGSLSTVATTVAYTLDGAAGDRVLLRMTEAVTGNYLTPRLRVYQADGTLVATAYNSYTAELNTVTLPAAGIYTVLALDNAGIYPGDYYLHCQRMNGPVGVVPIAYGETVAGDLANRSETDAYALDGTAADLLLARLGEIATAIEPMLRLYDASGALLDGVDHSSLAELPLTALPASETYTLLVMDDPGLDTGSYNLHVQRINGPAGATPLVLGMTRLDSVPTSATTVAYTLDAAANDQVLLRMAEEVTGSYLAPRLRVYQQTDGTVVATTYHSLVAELNTVELPTAGTYTVLALDNAGVYTGEYRLHCQCTNAPVGAVGIGYGDSRTGELLLRGETNAYTFTAGASDTVLVRMTEIATAIEPRVRLYGPDGLQLAEASDTSEAEFSGVRLTAAGDYTLLAMDDPGLDTGDYVLQLIGGQPVSAVSDEEVPVVAFALHGCSPNPFNPATTVRFDLPAAANVLLDVYSLRGGRVATLVAEPMPAGRHAVTWRGDDDAGRRVASGIYLVRFRAAGREWTMKTTLLK